LPLALAGCLAALGPQLAHGDHGIDVRTAAAEVTPTDEVTPTAAPASAVPSGEAAPSATAATAADPSAGAATDTSSPADTADSPSPTAADTATADAQETAGTQLPATAADGNNEDQQPTPAVNPNCTLRVPPRPLSGQGLATPYVLSGTGDGGACHEANPDQAAFVEATIVNRRTGQISVYHPLVVDRGTRPAVVPTPPRLRRGDVVGIWFGFNGDTLTLEGARGSLTQGSCVNGFEGSKFGQFAHCNAPAFFDAANAAIAADRLDIPELGTGADGLPCPTVRDFGVVDQDQSDNVTTTYLVTPDGRTAQDTEAARGRLPGATTVSNGSDNALLDKHIDPALGCTPFTAPSRTDNGTPVPSLALNELHAATHQAAPIALIPLNNPMTLVDGQQSAEKTNLYRAAVNQPLLGDSDAGDPEAYCTLLDTVGRERITADQEFFAQAPSPGQETANLYEFLTERLQSSLEELACDEQ
jgi:hypothetical protein